MVTTDAKIETRAVQKDSSAQGGYPHATPVRPSRPRRLRPVIRGQDGTQWKDLYHTVLTVPWWAFFLGLAGFFVALNAVFAIFYYFDPHGLLNARPGSFWDVFFFSIQTIGSLNSPIQP